MLLKLKALDLAKYILVKAEILGQPVSNFQLQQILYIIQKYFLLKDKYAFLEYFYAWRMGPVIPRVYCEFSYYAGHPIRIAHFTKPFIVLPFVPDFKEVVNSIIEKCCQIRPVEMQKIIGDGVPLREIVIMFYIANEGISFIENVSEFLPLPQKMKDIFIQIREKDVNK